MTLDEAIQASSADGLVTGWILVMEKTDPEGNRWIDEEDSETMTPWLRAGILTYLGANTSLQNDEWELEDAESEDDDG